MTVTDRPTRSSARGVLASESRLQVLDALRKNNDGMDASDLAVLFGLHVSTVRFHLGELCRAGLVDAYAQPGIGRGRPRKLYYPVTVGGAYTAADARNDRAPLANGYEHLARVLAASWDAELNDDSNADNDNNVDTGNNADTEIGGASGVQARSRTGRRAEQAGRSWAVSQLHAPREQERTVRGASAKISGLFSEIGFDPELRHDGDSSQILLHACPFESVARDYPHVVCTLHLGLLRGALEQLGADVESDLQPRVAPNLCMAYIGPSSPHPLPAS